jgi:hypothetical protein
MALDETNKTNEHSKRSGEKTVTAKQTWTSHRPWKNTAKEWGVPPAWIGQLSTSVPAEKHAPHKGKPRRDVR